jgi:hypothetical protein
MNGIKDKWTAYFSIKFKCKVLTKMSTDFKLCDHPRESGHNVSLKVHVSSRITAKSQLYHFIQTILKALLQVDEFTYASLASLGA